MNSVIVADAHLFTCKGIAALVGELGPHQVVATAHDGRHTAQLAQELQPDLLVISADLDGIACLDAIATIKRRRPTQKVLVLCEAETAGSARETLRLGCEGFLRKNTSREELARAVAEVLAGRRYADPDISRRLLLAAEGDGHDRAEAALHALSQRERAVFRLIALGHTNRSAGEALHLSHKTVEKHRATAMRKLRLKTAVDLRLLAVELGIVRRDSLPVVPQE
ncbi:MAG: response regulator transcription factor [Proteobacteria bacterium]|nr:response regulator transcription factor [Pseudomonadota bacterium]